MPKASASRASTRQRYPRSVTTVYAFPRNCEMRTVVPAGRVRRTPAGISIASTSRLRGMRSMGILHFDGRGRPSLQNQKVNRQVRTEHQSETFSAYSALAAVNFLPGYSVETASCWPSSAACNVCHASVAHFTRAGNSETPENTASFPISSSEGCPWPVTRS